MVAGYWSDPDSVRESSSACPVMIS
jgi:hypothetical protein